MRKIKFLILLLAFMIFLTSCSFTDFIYQIKGDMSQISFDDEGNLLYNDNSYYRVDDYFNVRTSEVDEVFEIGVRSNFPFFPSLYYYVFDTNEPLFIFCGNGISTLYYLGLYVRSDYDIYEALYTIDNTNIEISLASALTESEIEASVFTSELPNSFTLKLKDDPRIAAEFWGPYEKDSKWYTKEKGKTWILNDEFVEILKANNIINQ